MKNNTIGKLVKNLKAFLNDRMRRNRIKPIDLSAFKVVQEEVDHIYLSDDEIQAIAAVDCKTDEELEKVKDFFVIGCLTGNAGHSIPPSPGQSEHSWPVKVSHPRRTKVSHFWT